MATLNRATGVLTLALLLATVRLAGCASADVQGAAPAPPPVAAPAPERSAAENPLGIRVTALRLTAGGFMVDLRYRIVDADRAKQMFDRRQALYLEDEASGARFAVPSTAKLGKLRPGSRSVMKPGRDYGILFANPGGFLRSGAKVRLVAGETQVAQLTVH